jgi:hypothetical protein
VHKVREEPCGRVLRKADFPYLILGASLHNWC